MYLVTSYHWLTEIINNENSKYHSTTAVNDSESYKSLQRWVYDWRNVFLMQIEGIHLPG